VVGRRGFSSFLDKIFNLSGGSINCKRLQRNGKEIEKLRVSVLVPSIPKVFFVLMLMYNKRI